MKLHLIVVLAAFCWAGVLPQDSAAAQTPTLSTQDAKGLTLEEFLWTKRPLVVFADSAADPAFIMQMQNLARDPAALAERDVVVITDTDPAAASALRHTLRPRGFSLVLVDKDGGVKLRKPLPWSVREITQAIDRTPLRRQEMLERRSPGG